MTTCSGGIASSCVSHRDLNHKTYSRFDYSPEFLAWALKPPGYLKEWHTGVRVTKSNKLVGFISGVPANIRSDLRTATSFDHIHI